MYMPLILCVPISYLVKICLALYLPQRNYSRIRGPSVKSKWATQDEKIRKRRNVKLYAIFNLIFYAFGSLSLRPPLSPLAIPGIACE